MTANRIGPLHSGEEARQRQQADPRQQTEGQVEGEASPPASTGHRLNQAGRALRWRLLRTLWLLKIASGLAQLPRWATLIVGMIDLLKLLGGLLVGVFRSHAAREAETAFLRQLQRSAPARLRLRAADRLIFVWLYRLFPSLLEAAVVFKPATLVRWHPLKNKDISLSTC